MTPLLAILLTAQLTTADVAALERFGGTEPGLKEEARRLFAGRGQAIAEHYLRRIPPEPSPAAVFFVLRAVGDPEATLALARALPEPPPAESGILDRHWTEVDAAIGATLESDRVRRDPRVVTALLEALERARNTPWADGIPEAIAGLLGHCRGQLAVDALRVLATDPDPLLRAAVTGALGWQRAERSGSSPPNPEAEAAVPTLATRLLADPDPTARSEAAASLGRLELPAGIEPLRQALRTEPEGAVVDEILGALQHLQAPVTDPEECRDVVARAGEATVARPCFERWRATVSRATLIRTALDAPPTLRALALGASTGAGRASSHPTAFHPPPVPPPPRGAHGGAATVHAIVEPPAHRLGGNGQAPAPPDLDAATREALLGAAILVVAEPRPHSTWEMGLDALWVLAGRDVGSALARTDRIASLEQRYWTSSWLARQDPEGYDHYRRTRELAVAAGLALPLLLLFAWPPARGASGIALVAVAIWGGGTFLDGSALSLPPWPYPLTKVRFLASAAAAVAVIVMIPAVRWWRTGALLLAGILFLTAYTATRRIALHPPDTQSGYLLLFEPVYGLVAVAFLTLVLSAFRPKRPAAA